MSKQVPSKLFKLGEDGFTHEDYVRLDALIGDDWPDLSDDELVGRLQKALTSLDLSHDSGRNHPDLPNSSAPIGSSPEVTAFFNALIADLNRVLRQGTKAASDRDARDAYAPGPVGPAVLPNASPAPGSPVAKVGAFLDNVSKMTKAELREAVEAGKTGAVGLSASESAERVRKSSGQRPSMAGIAKALDLDADLSDEQRKHLRDGQPLSWLLDVSDTVDEDVKKSAASLYGAVNELARRGGSITLR